MTPTSNLAVAPGYTHNRGDVPAGERNADLARLRVDLALSTRLTANPLLQYNDQDNLVSANVRINFIHRPGSDLFLVYNEERGTSDSMWHLNERAAVVKPTYLARL